MNDDVIDRLRRENPVPGALPAPPIEPVLARLGPRGPRRRRKWLGEAPAVLGVAFAVAIMVLAVVLLGHAHRGTPAPSHQVPPPSHATVSSYLNRAYRAAVKHGRACAPRVPAPTKVSDRPPSQELLSSLGVLRRRPTAVDRLSPATFQAGGPLSGGYVYERYVRRARVVDGISYYLIPAHVVESGPFATPTRCYAEQRAALKSLLRPLPAAKRAAIMRSGDHTLAQELQGRPAKPYDGIAVLTSGNGTGGSSCCQSASSLARQVSIGTQGRTVYGVVPDGVASVSLYYAKTASQDPLRIIARATHTVTVKVMGNMYVVKSGRWGYPAAVTYRSADGTVLKRFDTNQFPHMHLSPGATGYAYGP